MNHSSPDSSFFKCSMFRSWSTCFSIFLIGLLFFYSPTAAASFSGDGSGVVLLIISVVGLIAVSIVNLFSFLGAVLVFLLNRIQVSPVLFKVVTKSSLVCMVVFLLVCMGGIGLMPIIFDKKLDDELWKSLSLYTVFFGLVPVLSSATIHRFYLNKIKSEEETTTIVNKIKLTIAAILLGFAQLPWLAFLYLVITTPEVSALVHKHLLE